MLCVVIVEAVVLGIFNFWPIQEHKKNNNEINFGDDAIVMDEAVITQQETHPPAPPKPQMPIPEPTDKIIEEEIIELDEVYISEYSDSLSVNDVGTVGDANEAVSNPQTSPSAIRIVEATTPQAAKEANIKAEITVTFLVDKKGNVEDASISQIKIFDREDDTFKIIDQIDYGITEATLDAALQWKFRPARNNNEAVRAYSRQIFTFGF